MFKKIRLGDLLLEQKVIHPEQLEKALAYQQESGHQKLGNVLMELGFVSEEMMINTIGRQLEIPVMDLMHYHIQPSMLRLLPEAMAGRFRAIVLNKYNDQYLVAMSDPTDLTAQDEMARKLGTTLRLAIAKEADILQVIDLHYRKTEEIASLAEQLEDQLGQIDLQQEGDTDLHVDTPVIKLLSSIFEDALQVNASDIHIEPDKKIFRIRQRIDGVLQEQIVKERSVMPALISRIKLMAKLNISERHLPQDGRFSINIKNRNIDVRVSTLPVQYGESLVMRLLDQSKGILSLENLAMPPLILEVTQRYIKEPHGMILVTGPTGAGKSTTLYACLTALNSVEKKIITAEDPVEYTLPRINQVQVIPKIGLTFAHVLRSSLRQDPDIVMVGEIRDHGTATIALQAALTGHLVLSTVHTNDCISTPERLLNIGSEPFLVASAVKLILAQRLMRRLCQGCMSVYKPTEKELIWLSDVFGYKIPSIQFYQPRGCSRCAQTGYKGRMAVYEFLEINDELAYHLRRSDMASFAKVAKTMDHYRPLGHWALDYACQGLTSLDEVFRVAGSVGDDL